MSGGTTTTIVRARSYFVVQVLDAPFRNQVAFQLPGSVSYYVRCIPDDVGQRAYLANFMAHCCKARECKHERNQRKEGITNARGPALEIRDIGSVDSATPVLMD